VPCCVRRAVLSGVGSAVWRSGACAAMLLRLSRCVLLSVRGGNVSKFVLCALVHSFGWSYAAPPRGMELKARHAGSKWADIFGVQVVCSCVWCDECTTAQTGREAVEKKCNNKGAMYQYQDTGKSTSDRQKHNFATCAWIQSPAKNATWTTWSKTGRKSFLR
jgi:hypothetical protein